MNLRDLLVVEDEEVVRAVARRVLEPEGLVVDLAENAAAARSALARQRYRVLLCDLMLPGTSGFDLVRLARDLDPTLQTIVVTGYATRANAIGSFRLGAFDFIPKPFDSGELRAVVARALAFRQLAASAPAAEPRPGGAKSGEKAPAVYSLGGHAWARIEDQGRVVCGVAETFFRVLRPCSVGLPQIGDAVAQGRELARILADGDAVHRVWAPLSGTVLAANDRLASEVDLLRREPFTGGWLVRIAPDGLEEELPQLQTGRARWAPEEAVL